MTTETLTLTDFLLARIAEDEDTLHCEWSCHDRVLAECDAKRRIVESYVEEYGPEVVRVDHDTLRALAAVYAGHPDYRDEWRP